MTQLGWLGRKTSTQTKKEQHQNWKFSDKNSDIFHIENHWGSSNEYSQSMFFWAEIRKIMYTPVNPCFTVQKFKWVKII